MTNLKDRMHKLDIVELCTRERANTKWKFHKLTILSIFASLLKDVPMGCKDTILPEPLLKNHNVTCLILREIRDNPTMTIVSFYLVKLDSGTHFSLQRQSSSSHLVFYYRSRRISNAKQSSDEIEFS